MPREEFFEMFRLGQDGADVLSLVEVVQGMLDEDAIARGEPVGEPPEWVSECKRHREIILLQKKAVGRSKLRHNEDCRTELFFARIAKIPESQIPESPNLRI